jgi:hypothetical protein
MATSNRVSVTITPAIRDSFIALLDQAAALLPASPTLSSEERQDISTIGTRLQPFDDAVAMTVPQFPAIVPPYLDAAEADKDRASRSIVKELLLAATATCEKLRDLDLLLGADLFDFDHGVFYTARDAAKRGSIPGADTALAQLDAAYPKRGKKTPPPEPPPAP